jgi:hypothetical protein
MRRWGRVNGRERRVGHRSVLRVYWGWEEDRIGRDGEYARAERRKLRMVFVKKRGSWMFAMLLAIRC